MRAAEIVPGRTLAELLSSAEPAPRLAYPVSMASPKSRSGTPATRPWSDVEASLEATFARRDAAANDRAVADLVRGCRSAKQLGELFALELLADATLGAEDGHGAETTETVLAHVRAGGRMRLAAATLAATLAAPTLRSLLRWDGRDVVKGEARRQVAAFDGIPALLEASSPEARMAGWSLVARGEPKRWIDARQERDDDVVATLHLARAAAGLAPEDRELERPGLRGWAAALAASCAAGAVRGAPGERLVSALAGRPLRVPRSWGFGDATTTDLTSEALLRLDVDVSLLEPVVRSLRGEDAPRRIAELAFGPVVERGRQLVLSRVPPAGLRPDAMSPLVRALVKHLAELEASGVRDHHVACALGIGPGEGEALLGAMGPFAPWQPALSGFEGAPFHWLHRAAVLGGPPDVAVLAAHLLTLPASTALDLVLARMPRALLAAQVAAQPDPAVAWARDASLLDRLAPPLRDEVAARLVRYVVLGPDCPRALGRLVRAAGLAATAGAQARIADASRVYGD